jgi:hypothetical protein
VIRQGVPHGSKEQDAEVVEVAVGQEEHERQAVGSAVSKEDGGEAGVERTSESCHPVLF